MAQGKTISELVMEYFRTHPREELAHGPVVDWVTQEWLKDKKHTTAPRDVWRAIRALHQKGKLMKIKRGVYKFDPDYEHDMQLWEFPEDVKKAALKRDGYRCVLCGRREKDGVELVVDHKTPRDKGGTNDIENAEVLCSECNLMKKNYSQTEAGKRYFIWLYQTALAKNDTRIIQFCKDLFDVYNKHKLNSHIKRPNSQNNLK